MRLWTAEAFAIFMQATHMSLLDFRRSRREAATYRYEARPI
jgi:hypothetical protein